MTELWQITDKYQKFRAEGSISGDLKPVFAVTTFREADGIKIAACFEVFRAPFVVV
jgi:hypothetical protein